jgi:DNA gyrase subunit B
MRLHDCVRKDASETELLIVGEGPLYEAAKEGRDRLTQAVLVIDKTIACGDDAWDALSNDSCQSIIAALGVGIADKPLDMERLRYGRVIVVTDQSEEGLRIRNEVLRFLDTYSRPVLEEGHIFLPEPGVTPEEFEIQVLNAETRHLKAVKPGETREPTIEQ